MQATILRHAGSCRAHDKGTRLAPPVFTERTSVGSTCTHDRSSQERSTDPGTGRPRVRAASAWVRTCVGFRGPPSEPTCRSHRIRLSTRSWAGSKGGPAGPWGGHLGAAVPVSPDGERLGPIHRDASSADLPAGQEASDRCARSVRDGVS
jgi:hypothetical protein